MGPAAAMRNARPPRGSVWGSQPELSPKTSACERRGKEEALPGEPPLPRSAKIYLGKLATKACYFALINSEAATTS